MAGKQVELGAEFMHGDATAIAVLAARHRLRLWWLCTWAQVRGLRRVPCAHAPAPRVCAAVALLLTLHPGRCNARSPQGDGGPLSEKAPDGGCAYYYVGADHKCVGSAALPAFRRSGDHRACRKFTANGGPTHLAPHSRCVYGTVHTPRDMVWRRLARFDEIDEDQEALHEALWSISEADEGAFVGKPGKRNVCEVRAAALLV